VFMKLNSSLFVAVSRPSLPITTFPVRRLSAFGKSVGRKIDEINYWITNSVEKNNINSFFQRF
jgi:hypothetical protein